MSKPAPHNNPVNSSETGWVSRLNANFEDCLDSPFPMGQFTDSTALTTAHNPKLFKDCLALVGASGSVVLYSSDGATWSPYREQLTFIADLVPGVATVTDIKNAYNGLLADMTAKKWMSA